MPAGIHGIIDMHIYAVNSLLFKYILERIWDLSKMKISLKHNVIENKGQQSVELPWLQQHV